MLEHRASGEVVGDLPLVVGQELVLVGFHRRLAWASWGGVMGS